MAVLDGLRVRTARWLLRGIKAVNSWGPQWVNATFFEPTFTAVVREGLRANGAVFACMSELAFAFPEPKLRVFRDTGGGPGTILSQHPALDLLRNPHEQIGRTELLALTIMNVGLGGNGYWYKLRNGRRRVVGLIPFSPAQIRPVPGGSKLVSHYERIDLPPDAPVSQKRIRPQDIVHFKWLPDPLQPWLGLAPIVSVAREVDTDNEATRYVFRLLKNDAIPRLMMTADPDAAIDTRRLQKQWSEQHGGENRGGVAFLEGGLTPHKLNLDLQELAFETLRRVPEARICAAFRVPPVLAGVNVGMDQMTYNNVLNMRRHFVQDTMVRIWTTFAETLTKQLLVPDFDGHPNETLGFDLNTVVALQESKDALRTWANDALSRRGITINEYRDYIGLPHVEGGDTFLEPSAAPGLAGLRRPRHWVVDAPVVRALHGKRLSLPEEVRVSQAEADEAIQRWDYEMPGYDGLLEAEPSRDDEE